MKIKGRSVGVQQVYGGCPECPGVVQGVSTMYPEGIQIKLYRIFYV